MNDIPEDECQIPGLGGQLARFECAQETIIGRMALRTHWIWRERRKEAPDEVQIAAWLAERDRLQDELDALRFHDTAAFERIRRDYSPELLADFKANRERYAAEVEAREAQYLAELAARSQAPGPAA